ncbi:hypothetical protein P3W85_29715 [Cupriavidus basilensis]|uniref:Uncharacterized protein n=1 Tax=Cupriavidus basilensis TaxID=68895 RepID=A0ABT6AWV7_9BURK|nr:hypothetical protein [Cupriavidus basilensis]MDF3837100.1 hypothetical protein [Cupriavidus basilensis]
MALTCTCITDIEAKVAETMTKKIGSPATAKCESIGFTFGKACGIVHLTNFKVTAEKKGWTRGKSIPMQASFCPFCGKATKEAA